MVDYELLPLRTSHNSSNTLQSTFINTYLQQLTINTVGQILNFFLAVKETSLGGQNLLKLNYI